MLIASLARRFARLPLVLTSWATYWVLSWGDQKEMMKAESSVIRWELSSAMKMGWSWAKRRATSWENQTELMRAGSSVIRWGLSLATSWESQKEQLKAEREQWPALEARPSSRHPCSPSCFRHCLCFWAVKGRRQDPSWGRRAWRAWGGSPPRPFLLLCGRIFAGDFGLFGTILSEARSGFIAIARRRVNSFMVVAARRCDSKR